MSREKASRPQAPAGQQQAGPLQHLWRSYNRTWHRLFRPLCAIRVSVPLPSRGCSVISYLLNEWLIPAGIAIAIITAFSPLTRSNLWQAIPAAAAAQIAVYKVAAIRLRPARK